MSHVVTSEFFNEEQLRQDARGKLKSLAECTVASSLNAQGASAILSGTALLSMHVGNILLGRAPFGYSGTEESLGQDENIYTSTKAQFDIRHRRKAAEVACGAGFLH